MLRALFLVLSTTLAVPPASADDFSRIPEDIRSQIKTKCIGNYPDDYVMQYGCISMQSKGYLKVHGNDIPKSELTVAGGVPSAYDLAQVNNAAYLTVVKMMCRIDVDAMLEKYRQRVFTSARLNEKQVGEMIAAGIGDQQRAALVDGGAFCAVARANLPKFVADLKN